MTQALFDQTRDDIRGRALWPIRRLDDLVTVTSASGVPRDDPTMPFVGMEHIEAERGSVLGAGDPRDYESSAFIAAPGQVLYGRLRPYLNKVFIPTARVYASREFIPMRPGADIDARFLLYRLRAHDFVQFATSLNSGDRPRVKWPQIRGFPIHLPSLPEQHRIVAILEEQLSRLDAALESVHVARERAAQFRRSLLHAGFTGVLTGHAPLLDSCPEGWTATTLGKVASWGSGGTPKSGTPEFYGGSIPWAVIGDLTEGLVWETAQTITRLGLDASSARLVDAGTVMVAMYGASIGRTGIAAVAMATNQAIAHAQCDEDVVVRSFLLLYLQSQKEAFVRAGQGGAQPNISQTILKAWPIALPPVAEQQRIVDIVEAQLSRLDASLAIADVVEKRCAALRRSLLHAAFTGRLSANDGEHVHV